MTGTSGTIEGDFISDLLDCLSESGSDGDSNVTFTEFDSDSKVRNSNHPMCQCERLLTIETKQTITCNL